MEVHVRLEDGTGYLAKDETGTEYLILFTRDLVGIVDFETKGKAYKIAYHKE